MQNKIIQLENELIDLTLEHYISIENIALPTRKRAITKSTKQLAFSRIRRVDLSRFSGKTSRELIDYFNKQQIKLEEKRELKKGDNHRDAIIVTIKSLEGTALSKWLIQNGRLTINNQNKYVEFCKDYIIDPTNYKANAIIEKITTK